jgi:hypothetical protein
VKVPILLLGVVSSFSVAAASEADALQIEANLEARHKPFGTILDPIFEAPGSDVITGYTRCGDSAIWTGHYLAAESYRYAVTRAPEALQNVRYAIDGLRKLIDVTGADVLARCIVPVDSPYATGLVQEEQHHGIFIGIVDQRNYFWAGNTSRDQYSGAFFGLAVAYDLVNDSSVRGSVHYLVQRMLDRLLKKAWLVVMPNGDISTTFWGRADQQLAFLKIGSRVDGQYSWKYQTTAWTLGATVLAPISLETTDVTGSYFKFNLDTINLFGLIRLEGNLALRALYREAYTILRRTTDDHGNAHFNMIDRALNGPDDRRDAETRELLNQWLQRPRRDFKVDLRGVYDACGDNQACQPVPVVQRVPASFLWEVNPFQLSGGGDGFIEGAGIDYLLPYWMARYYGVVAD